MKKRILLSLFLLFIIMGLTITLNIESFKTGEISDSIEIEASPEKIWEFLSNLEENYKDWHPQDHVSFKWSKGKPMEIGSTFYAEEFAMGKLKQYEGKVIESIPNRKIVFAYSFPISILSPTSEWIIEPMGTKTVFTAKMTVRCETLLQMLMPTLMEDVMESGKEHMSAEGKNLKRLMEEN